MKEKVIKILIIIGVALLSFAICFGFWALVIKIFSMCFGFAFKWCYVVGAAIAYSLIQNLFVKNNDN